MTFQHLQPHLGLLLQTMQPLRQTEGQQRLSLLGDLAEHLTSVGAGAIPGDERGFLQLVEQTGHGGPFVDHAVPNRQRGQAKRRLTTDAVRIRAIVASWDWERNGRDC